MAKVVRDGNNISIEGPFSESDLLVLKECGHIEKFSLTRQENLTVKVARALSCVQSIKQLFLWSSVNRTAMRYVITMPDLEVLDILEIRTPGKLKYFSEAASLLEFRCNHYMTEADLLEISNLPKVKEIGAQNSHITKRALEKLLVIPSLENLDLEAATLTDKLVEVLAGSKTLKHLSVGASGITAKGLQSLSCMEQLESLDIWSIDIDEADLEQLSKLQNLKYLSLGCYEDQTRLTYKE